MTDPTGKGANSPSQQPVHPPDTPPTAPGSIPGVGTDLPPGVIEKGKLFAVLSYACNFIRAPFWIVPLVMRDNAFSLYHAKQNLVLFLCMLACAILCIPLMFVCIGYLLYPLLWVTGIAFIIIGLINVSNNQMKPLPVIGGLAESWFSGITLQPASGTPASPTPPAGGTH